MTAALPANHLPVTIPGTVQGKENSTLFVFFIFSLQATISLLALSNLGPHHGHLFSPL